MLTTNTIKVKERSQENEKLTMITTGKTKPKDFELKGKGAPPSDDIITTGNMAQYLAQRKKDIVKERVSAKIRQKKLDEKIAVNKDRE